MNHYDQQFKQNLVYKHQNKIKLLLQKHEQNKQFKHNQSQTTSNTTTNTDNVINLSNTNLNKQQLNVLSKGLKFVPTPQSINIITTITNCETGVQNTPHIIKKAAISEITAFVNKWRKPNNNNMSNEEIIALNGIKSMNDIIIVQAVKGSKIIILNKQDYINKIEDKLNDKNIYEQIKKDPMERLTKEIKLLATKLFREEKITQAKKFQLTGIDDLPTVRGQPKLHKNNAPMRIVTCSRDTILSPTSKFVFNVIKDLRSTITSVICSSLKFVQQIMDTSLQHDDNLASLDIVDLFTNIPVKDAVTIAIKRLTKTKKLDNSKLTINDIEKSLLLCLNNSFVQFNNKYYKQKQDLPIGNALSPLLADLYMDEYTKTHLQQVNQSLKLWRYVDDILIITKTNKQQLENYVNEINNINSTIRFTSEYEKNKSISFLDTKLTKLVNNSQPQIKIRWFRKDTASDLLLNYQSCHSNATKTNIVKNMTTRIIQTTKDPTEQQKDINTLKKMLINSNYSPNQIERLIKDVYQSITNTNNNLKKDNETKYSISLPYISGIEVLKRRLEKLKIKLYFSYPNKLQA
ncbi:unnamed protein product [Rotaria sp. Silwood1]|nr:unnamed protein product [Rotaria sp. Silwood1]